MKQADIDWFRPVWRRVLVTAIVAGWAAMEWFVWRDDLFRWVALLALAYAIWSFFIAFDKGNSGGDPPP